MRILQLCPKPPIPSLDGGCLAMNAMTQGFLSQGHSVKMLVVSTEKHPFKREVLSSEYVNSTSIEAVELNTTLNPIDALKNLIQGKSYHIERFYSQDFANKLVEILSTEKFDIIFIESLFLASYANIHKANSKAKLVLRAHNVEHCIWEGLAKESSSGIKKWYLSKLAAQLKEYESTVINNFNALITITAEDEATFIKLGTTIPTHTSPFGLEFTDINTETTNEVNHVFHFGSMDWKPNVQGVEWLVKEVWPIVRKSMPEALLVLAGRNMPDTFKTDLDQGIEVIGEVDSAAKFLSRPGIMTIPIHSGSGMRVKAIEGMSAGKPTVSTTIGVCGLGLTHGKHALISDSKSEFASSLVKLLKDPTLANDIGNSGRKHIHNNFSNKLIISDLTAFLDKKSP